MCTRGKIPFNFVFKWQLKIDITVISLWIIILDYRVYCYKLFSFIVCEHITIQHAYLFANLKKCKNKDTER